MEVQETLGGRYKLLHELGTGGMAVVWRARDEVLGRPVAVKVLAGRFAGDPQSRARIRDEARAAATLSHPNIAQVYDYGESADDGAPRPYVVMELVNGPTLQQRVAGGPLPPRTIFRICGEVAAALAAAHADGLVHRDIKMANIMVTATGAKVVDFGIAAAVGPASPEEMLVGTPAYLAPERLTGDAVQAASDVYALGVLLFRLLAHQPPWTVETTTQMLNAHIYIEPSPLPALPGVPPEVADLIDRCLRKNPAERPTASEVSATLGDAAEAALLSVRGEQLTQPAVPSPRAVESEEYDELTSASLHREPAGGGRRSVPGRGGAFVPGAEIGAVRSPLPGAERLEDSGEQGSSGRRRLVEPDAEDPDPASGGRRRADMGFETGVVAAGESEAATSEPNAGATDVRSGNARPGYRRAGDGRPGSWVEPGPARAVGELDGVRKRRRGFLLAGAGVATLLSAVLAFWGLADRRGPAEQASSGAAGGALSVPPTGAVRPSPGGRSGTVSPPGGEVGAGHPLSSVSASSVSAGPSVAPSSSPSDATSPPSGEPSAVAPTEPVGSRLSSDGGVVYAVCSQGKGQLTSWQPNSGYTVQRVDPGPALAPDIVFAGLLNRYRMTVTCVGGTPAPLVLPL